MSMNVVQNGDLTGGLSNYTLLIICCTGITLIVSTLVLLCHRSSADPSSVHNHGDHNETYDEMLERADKHLLTRAQRRARAKVLMKKNRKLPPPVNSENVQEPFHHANDQDILNVHVDSTNEIKIRTITPRKIRKERAKELEKQQRQIHEKKMPDNENQNVLKEMKFQTKSDIDKKEREEAVIRQKNRWKYMFYSSEREKRESLVTVSDFISDVYKHPIQSITSYASILEVSTNKFVDRLLELEKEGRIPLLILHLEQDRFSMVTLEHMKQIQTLIQDSQYITMEDIANDLSRVVQRRYNNTATT